MKKKIMVYGVAFVLIAGVLFIAGSISSWAFEEKNPTIQEQLERSRQQTTPYQNIPSQQGSDAFPTRMNVHPDEKPPIGRDRIHCWGECMNASGSEYVWRCGYIRSEGGKYYIDNFECGRQIICQEDRSCPNTTAQNRGTSTDRFKGQAK